MVDQTYASPAGGTHREWPVLWNYVRDRIMPDKWLNDKWYRLHELCSVLREPGHEEETPAAYLACKQRHRQCFKPIYPDALEVELIYGKGDLASFTDMGSS